MCHAVSDHWLFSEDCVLQRFCGSPDGVMVCGNVDGREVYAVTHDIVPGNGWVMQFKVSRPRHGFITGFRWSPVSHDSHAMLGFGLCPMAIYLLTSRWLWAVVSQNDSLRDRSMSSTRWTLAYPGGTWCPNACPLTRSVGGRCPSHPSSSRLRPGNG